MTPDFKFQYDGSFILATPAERVEVFDRNLVHIVQNMAVILQERNGAGLAAPQVNISQQILVLEFFPFTMINPKIEKTEGTQTIKEGCLSFPGLFFNVKRSKDITVTWQDQTGEEHTQEFKNLEATVIQHEVDHLNGVVFTERAPATTVLLAKKQLFNSKKGPRR
jgi:peptide deformylase